MTTDYVILSVPLYSSAPPKSYAVAEVPNTIVADCPTEEAARAAYRLLSGEALRGLRR